MDALKAEIALKRKTVQDDAGTRPSKYMRRGDLERLKEEEERRAREEKEKQRVAQEVAEKNATAARNAQKQKVSSSCHLNHFPNRNSYLLGLENSPTLPLAPLLTPPFLKAAN